MSDAPITERPRAQEQFSEFKATVDRMLDCVYMFRAHDFRFVYVNAGAKMQVGYTEAEMLQMTPMDIKPEFTPERFRQMVQPLLDGAQRSLTFETLHRHKDGHDIPVEIFLQLVPLAGHEARFVAIVRDVTKRKRAEAAMREALETLDAIVDGAFIFDPQTLRFSYVNEGAVRQVGYSREELLLMTPLDIKPEFDEPQFRAMIAPLVSGAESALSFTTVHRRKDGVDVPVETNLQCVGADTAQARMIAIVRDITERKRAEAAMREALETLDAIVDGAFIFDPQTLRFSYVNEGAVRQVGYSREELLLMTPLDIKPEFDEPQFRAMIAPLVSGAESALSFTTVYRRKDGVDVPVETNLQCVGADTAQARMIAIVRDITERKRLEEKFRRVVEGAPNAIILVNQNGAIALVNAQAEMLFGYSREELRGQSIETLVPARFRGAHPGHRAAFFADSKTRAMGAGRDLYGLHKDGREIPIEIGLNPIETEEGLMVLSSIIDITDRKRMEEALRRAHDELERRVQERTVELHLKNRDLETLLYVTSHDLREPLRSIENFSRLVQDRYAERLDDKGKDFLRRVVRGAQRMDRLMTDLLALSRVQRMELPVEDVEGASLVQAALRQLEGRIKETGAQVRVANDLPRLRVNETWGTQAISNLIANALKFTSNGHAPEVEVAPYRPGDGEISSGIVVRDRGPGVAPEHAERIFQLFQRAVGREVEGTGAGLAIVRQVAERHGGRAWAQPREGGGSEFIITFGSTHTSERNPS